MFSFQIRVLLLFLSSDTLGKENQTIMCPNADPAFDVDCEAEHAETNACHETCKVKCTAGKIKNEVTCEAGLKYLKVSFASETNNETPATIKIQMECEDRPSNKSASMKNKSASTKISKFLLLGFLVGVSFFMS